MPTACSPLLAALVVDDGADHDAGVRAARGAAEAAARDEGRATGHPRERGPLGVSDTFVVIERCLFGERGATHRLGRIDAVDRGVEQVELLVLRARREQRRVGSARKRVGLAELRQLERVFDEAREASGSKVAGVRDRDLLADHHA